MTQTVTVVAAAIVRDGRVLAGERSYPPELAGRWELPGGKVQDGETDEAALEREILEELGVRIEVGARVGADLPIAVGVLRVYRCTLTDGEPAATEHRAIRWLAAAGLDTVRWLDADRPLLPHLRRLLAGG